MGLKERGLEENRDPGDIEGLSIYKYKNHFLGEMCTIGANVFFIP